MTAPLLTVRDLTIRFSKQAPAAVKQLNFDILAGQCLSLVGESGSGKSLTALAIMQLLPHAARVSGKSQIYYAGQDLLTCSENQMRDLRGDGIGMIFQDAMTALNPVFTIGDQLMEVLCLHQGLTKRQAKLNALELLTQVGIKDPQYAYQAYPHQLSGGQRQRAMIAMALCCQPKLLIADEPTTALDVTTQAQILELLKTLQQKNNMTLLFVSHDLAVVSQLADEVVVLKAGELVEKASAAKFFQAPQHQYSKALLAAIPEPAARHQGHQEKELLCVKNLKVYFPIRRGVFKRTVGYVKAVDNISFEIPRGQTLALVGESGSGKTTSGKAVLNLLSRTAGQIKFSGQDISQLSRHELRALRSQMQIVFQDPYSSLNPRMLVADSIIEGLLAQQPGQSRKTLLPRIDELLTQVGLSLDSKWRYPHEFSGGQRQRICIARALALKPSLLILDEPTSALDVSIQMQILKLLEQLQQQLGLSYLLITHNLAVVAYMAEYLAVMQQGKIVERGLTTDLLANPQQVYTQQLLASIPKIIGKRE